MWPFSHRPSRSSSTRSRHSSFKLRLESLETRNLLSHVIHIAVPINAQVVNFVEAHVGQVVGDGECGTLAQDAVQSGNGVPFYQLGPTGPYAAYVWGKLITTLTPGNGNVAGIQPGDILQFINVTEKDTMTVTSYTGQTRTSIYTQSPYHHTAIVTKVGGTTRNDLQVLQSNVNLGLNLPNAAKLQKEDQGGIYWGGSITTTLNYPQYSFSITVTHTMTSGVIEVYQPYMDISITVPSPPKFF